MRSFVITALLAIGLSLTACDMQANNVGKTLPDLKFDKISGTDFQKGKPALVEFWATWCPPCRQSIPHLNEVFGKYNSKGLQVIGISNEDKGKIQSFMKTLPMNYTVVTEPSGSLANGFGVRGIPHALLVDKTGKIVWEGHPMQMTDTDIEKALK